MDNLELNIDFLLNAPKAKAEAKAIEKEIEGVADTAEKSAKRVKQNVDAIIDATKKNVKKGVEEVEKLNQSTQNMPSNNNTGSNGNSNNSSTGTQTYNTNKSLLDSLNEQLNTAKKQANEAIDKGTLANANAKIQQYENEIKRLSNVGKKGFDELGNAIQKNEGVLGKLWSKVYQVANILPGVGVAGLIAFATEPIIAYISQLDIFKHKATEAELAAEAMKNALAGDGEYAKAIANINLLKINVGLVGQNLYSEKAVVEDYNKSIGAVAGQVKNLGEVEQGIAKNGENFIQMTLRKAIAMQLLEEASKKQVDAIKERNKSDVESISDFQKFQAVFLKTTFNVPIDVPRYVEIARKNKDKKAKEFEDEKESLRVLADKYQKEAADFAKKMGGVLGFDTTKTKVDNSYVDRAESLQRQIFEIQNEYSRKRMSKDEEELQAVRDRFGKLQAEILKFNKDPKSKMKVNGSGLDETKQKAIDDLKYKQETEKLKVNLTEQKGLYAEYEEYKKNFGEEKAKERFAKELDVNKSYIAILTDEYDKLSGKDSSKLSGVESERLEALKKLLATAKVEKLKADDEVYKQALDAAKTYNDKLIQIDKDFEQKRNSLALNKSDTPERLVELDKAKKIAIDAAKDEALAKTEIYKKLAVDTIELTRTQVVAQLEVLKELLKNANLPEEMRKAIEGDIQKFEYTLKIGIEQSNLQSLQQQIFDLTSELNQTDSEGKSIVSEKERKRILAALTEVQNKIKAIDKTGDGLASWSDKVAKNFEYLKGSSQEVAEGLSRDFSRLSGAFSDFSNKVGGSNTELGKSLESLSKLASVGSSAAQSVAGFASGDIVGGVSGALGAIGGIISMVSEMDAEYKNFYKNIVEGERKYQEALIERQLIEAKTNPIKYKALASEINILSKQVKDYNKEYKEIFETLQAQPYVFEVQQEKILGITVANHNILASMKGKTFAEIKQLLLEGRLLDGTKELAERLVDLEQKGFDATQALADLSKQAAEIFTGTTADSLTESLLTMFKEGKTGVQDLADFFETTMKDASLSIFKNKVLSEAMNSFYDEFTKATDGGALDANKISQLKDYFDSLITGANSQFQAIQQITGLNLSNSTSSSSSSMVGTIQRSLTEQTGSEFVGLQRNMYDQTKKGNAIAVDTLSSIRESATTLKNIESNTAKTVETLKDAVNELKDINKNTKPTGAYDRGW